MSADTPAFDAVLVGTGLGVYTLATALHAEYGIVSTTVTRIAVEAQRRSVASVVRELGASATDDDVIAELLTIARTRAAEDRIRGLEPRPLLLLCNEDALVELFARHREVLEQHYRLPIPSDAALRRIVDKGEFAQLCRDLGVSQPVTEIIDLADDSPIPPLDMPFPVVAKVTRASDLQGLTIPGYRKVYFIQSQQELDDLWRRHREAGFRGRFVVQELVPGDDTAMWSITAYRDGRGEVTLLSSAQVLLEEHTVEALGRPASMITTAQDDLLDMARRVLDAIDYRGFANFDVKRDPRTGEWKFFEINPRIGRNNFYVTAAGANVARFVVSDAILGAAIEPVVVTRSILYTLLPVRFMMRYVLDAQLRAKVKQAAREKVANPWVYGPDGGWARRYAQLVGLNHVRKFLRHYPRPTESGF